MSLSDSARLPTAIQVPPVGDPRIGAVISERYRVLARLGEGGMGTVYRAEHVLMKKTVALKLLHAELGTVEEAARRFEREAQSASRLNHPNIVAVTDFGRTAAGELFLAMEYIEGESLADRLDRERALPVHQAVDIARQILLGLEHAHGQGVIHRDLKPANIMLARYLDPRRGEVAKILDFGIAKMSELPSEVPGDASQDAGASGAGPTRLTQGAMVFGTPSYMSPEQATAQDADARSDIYSSGVMVYEMLTGRKPFAADDLVKVMALQVTAAPPSFATAAPDRTLSSGLEAAVMRALEKDKMRRFQSSAEFREALEDGQVGGLVAVAHHLPSLLARAGARATRAFARLPWRVRRWVPLGVAALALALVALPVVCTGQGTAPTATPPPPRPVEPALKLPLRRIEDTIARGSLAEARLLLMQQISEHPNNARIRYLLGNLEFAEKNAAAGLGHYTEALERDAGMRGDAALLLNVRKTLADRTLGRQALDIMINRIGKPVANDLARIATEDRRMDFRQAARQACPKLGCDDDVDLVRSYALDLQQGKTCDERRAAVRSLAATGDKRAVEPLKKALRAAGGLQGLFGGGNTCIKKDLHSALKELDG